MLKKRKSVITLLGFPLLPAFLVLLIIIYLVSKFQKKVTTQDKIINTLTANGLNPITAIFAFCQAAHETGNFTSPLFLANNNCFGMKMPVIRPTTADKESLGYAHYKSIEDSAKDFYLYYKYVNLPSGLQTLNQYVTGLYNKGYFEAPLQEYINGVQHFYNLYYAK